MTDAARLREGLKGKGLTLKAHVDTDAQPTTCICGEQLWWIRSILTGQDVAFDAAEAAEIEREEGTP